MKILFLFPHFLSPGGAANVVLQFAKDLRLRNYEVEILCARVSEEFRRDNHDVLFHEMKIPASNSIFYWMFFPFWQSKINKQLKCYEDYILFPQVLPSNWWAWFFKKRNKNVQVLWYCHEPSAFIHSKEWIEAIPVSYMKWGAKKLNPFLKKTDMGLEKQNNFVICNSNFTKQQYENIYKRKANAVIYPPFSVDVFPHHSKKENFILTVGRLSKFKRVDTLIKIFKIVSAYLTKTRLIVVGSGEEKKALEQLAHRLQVQDRVFFMGTVSKDQLAELYEKAKVTVICSQNEPFGLVPIESMIHGTPVIAHNSGGPKETIQHGRTGFLFNDGGELEQLIKQVFDMGEDAYFQMQKNCLREVIRYDVSNSVDQLELAFREMKSKEK